MTDIKYSLEPIDEILEHLCASGGFDELLFPQRCYELMKKGDTFREAYAAAIKSSIGELCLSKADTETLASIGGFLGTTDAQGQTTLLEGRKGQLMQLLDEAHENDKRNGKLWRAAGILAGAAALVLFG